MKKRALGVFCIEFYIIGLLCFVFSIIYVYYTIKSIFNDEYILLLCSPFLFIMCFICFQPVIRCFKVYYLLSDNEVVIKAMFPRK